MKFPLKSFARTALITTTLFMAFHTCFAQEDNPDIASYSSHGNSAQLKQCQEKATLGLSLWGSSAVLEVASLYAIGSGQPLIGVTGLVATNVVEFIGLRQSVGAREESRFITGNHLTSTSEVFGTISTVSTLIHVISFGGVLAAISSGNSDMIGQFTIIALGAKGTEMITGGTATVMSLTEISQLRTKSNLAVLPTIDIKNQSAKIAMVGCF